MRLKIKKSGSYKFSKKYLTKNYINSLNDINIVKYSNLRLQKNSIKKTDIYLKYMTNKF